MPLNRYESPVYTEGIFVLHRGAQSLHTGIDLRGIFGHHPPVEDEAPIPAKGLENPAALDAMAFDEATGELTLAMFETRPWFDLDLQLYQLQEKLNAYVSFAVDGELTDSFPDYADQPLKIQLRTVEEPPSKVLEFASLVRRQLDLMEINFEIVRTSEEESGGCGSPGCRCRG